MKLNSKIMPALVIGDLVAKLPIVQGGMGVGISLSSLASAVSNTGGIGVLSAAGMGLDMPAYRKNPIEISLQALKEEIKKTKALTKGIIGVNIMVALSNFTDMVKTSIKENVDIIFAGAGLPLDLPKYIEDGSRTKLVPIISSAKAAGVILKKWVAKYDYLPDAFVVEGPLAGGHLGFKEDQIYDSEFSLETLVPQVINAVNPYQEKYGRAIPVIAGGGIYSGEDIQKWLSLGAKGVQIGTRFAATHECDASLAFKMAYVNCKEEDIVIINSPVGLPGRAIRNAFIEAAEKGLKRPPNCPYRCIKTCNHKESPYCICLALMNAKKGDLQNGFVFAGQNAARISEIVSVRELMESLKDEYSAAASKPEAGLDRQTVSF